MLDGMKKETVLKGYSKINGEAVEAYSATLDSENPGKMYVNKYAVDAEKYRDNRETCRKDAEEFEEMAYEEQRKMIESQNAEK